MKKGLISSSSSSIVCRNKTSSYRRVVVSDDSLDKSSSESMEGNTFLSDDRSETTSNLNKRSSSEIETGSFSEVLNSDSFVVSDNAYLTDDASFLSQSDDEFLFKGTPSARRNQPLRCAKLNSEAMLNPVYDAGISALGRKEDAKGSQFFGITLQHSDSAIPDVINDRSALPLQFTSSSVQEGRNERQPKEVSDSDGSDKDEDDRLESYFKKLREETGSKKKRVGCERVPLSSFIVNDSDVSSPSNSVSGESDESWYPNDINNEEGNKEQERQLLTSLKDSEADQDEHFLASLSPDYLGKRHPDAEIYLKKGVKNKTLRNELTKRLFDIFRLQCFSEELPEHLTIKWNPRLRKTAGLCRNKSDRSSWIELSPKVCSTPDRVRDTLVHEMCHAAVWIVDGLRKDGHGLIWKKWASRCMQRFRSLPIINRCHDYEIEAKFIYECGGCGQIVKRHTKSLDINRKICGICKCTFTLRNSSHVKTYSGNELEHNPFAKFVKENYSKYRKSGIKHGEVMRTLSQLYKAHISTEDDSKGATPEDGIDISVLSLHD